MTLRAHVLGGCSPTPLALYLKALGIHRLVAVQADGEARADWSGDRFRLLTQMDRADLVHFFLHRFVPTPIVAPWNGGSGFYPKDNRDALDALRKGDAPRFGPYRAAIERGRTAVGRRQKRPDGDDKRDLVFQLRREATNEELAWINAAIASVRGELEYPALLGTGGNDGRLDFTNNQMQRLVEVFNPSSGEPLSGSEALLEQSLFGAPTPGLLADRAIGQFFPGSAGGANATAGFEGSSLINPWDFILVFEGATLFRVAAARRMESEVAQAAAPFAVRAQAAGYASASPADESARGEQWMPLWGQPASLAEVEAMFAEGRLQVNAKPARRAVDAALAVARLGTSRGVVAFERYGYIERNGQANLAVPLGRWRAPEAPSGNLDLLEPVMPWIEELRRGARKGAPAPFERAARRLETDVLAICERPDDPARWQTLTIDLGRTEAELVRRPRRAADLGLSPLPPLRVEWLDACGGQDASCEIRLAAAIASQRDPRHDGLGSIRRHVASISDPDSLYPRFVGRGVREPSVVWTGRDLVADLGAVVLRRLVEAQAGAAGSFLLDGRRQATLADLGAFLAGEVDEERVAGLARGLMAIRWVKEEVKPAQERWDGEPYLPVVYAAFRLLFMPAVPRGHPLHALMGRPDPRPLRLLVADRTEDALRAAWRRLSIRGVRPRVHHVVCDRRLSRRVLASLAIPISRQGFIQLRETISKPIPESRDSQRTAN